MVSLENLLLYVPLAALLVMLPARILPSSSARP